MGEQTGVLIVPVRHTLPRIFIVECQDRNERSRGIQKMPRQRQRVCLENGLKIDLNRLIREGMVVPGSKTDTRPISWFHNYHGDEIATGLISANLQGTLDGWFCIQIGEFAQSIMLVATPRHYGGTQWYFRCPRTNRRVSVLWKPPGARQFAGRHAWPGQVGYSSQFMDPINRAHHGQAKIKSWLIGDLDPEEWSLPPKPRWMRWQTYNRYVDSI